MQFFFNSAGFSLLFWEGQCKCSLPSCRFYNLGFWSRGLWLAPMHYGQKQQEVAHAHHLPKNGMRFRFFFVHALFLLKIFFKNYGFSGNVNGTFFKNFFSSFFLLFFFFFSSFFLLFFFLFSSFGGGGQRFMNPEVFTYHEKDFF